jgi:hypothetical protein
MDDITKKSNRNSFFKLPEIRRKKVNKDMNDSGKTEEEVKLPPITKKTEKAPEYDI